MELCTKCGTELNEEGVCPNCSAAEEKQPEPAEETTNKPSTAGNGKLNRLIAALVVIALLIACYAFTGRSYKKVAKDYMNAVLRNEPKKIAKLIPKDTADIILDAQYDGDKEKFYEALNDMSYLSKEIEDKDIKPSKVNVKIKDAEDMDEDELKGAKILYHSKNIKKGKKVTVEVKLPEEDNTREYTVVAVKKGRKWYLYG